MATALRVQNPDDVDEAERAVLERGGSMVVTLRPERRTADRGDLEALHRRLDEVETRVLDALERLR